MAENGGVAGAELLQLIERVERLQVEIDETNGDKAEVYKEAKGRGFDTNVMKAVVKRRRNGEGATAEADALLDLYESAIAAAANGQSKSASRTRTRGKAGEPENEEPELARVPSGQRLQ